MRYGRCAVTALPLAPVRDVGHEGGERGRWLAPTRITRKRSGKRRAPVIEHADQRARVNYHAHIVVESGPETDTVARGAHRHSETGHDQLRRWRHRHHATGLLELPMMHHTVAVPGPDPVMFEQMLRPAMPAQYIARSNHPGEIISTIHAALDAVCHTFDRRPADRILAHRVRHGGRHPRDPPRPRPHARERVCATTARARSGP